MDTRKIIDLFLNEKKIAIAGASHKPAKFGHVVFKLALDRGYNAIPVNLKGGIIENRICVESVLKLDNDVQNLLVVTHKRDTARVVEEAIAKGIRNIWIQNGCETKEAIQLAQNNNINLVSKTCFLMYNSPKGIHKFHQTISKWTGSYIKEHTV
jgi:predicted CoA-binding protein